MPASINARATKAQKENNVENIESKRDIVTNVARKALSDITNSLSDANGVHAIHVCTKKIFKSVAEIENTKPRVQNRLPSRKNKQRLGKLDSVLCMKTLRSSNFVWKKI